MIETTNKTRERLEGYLKRSSSATQWAYLNIPAVQASMNRSALEELSFAGMQKHLIEVQADLIERNSRELALFRAANELAIASAGKIVILS